MKENIHNGLQFQTLQMLQIRRMRETAPVDPPGNDPEIDDLPSLRRRRARLLDRRGSERGEGRSGRNQGSVNMIDLLEIQREPVFRFHLESELFFFFWGTEASLKAIYPMNRKV